MRIPVIRDGECIIGYSKVCKDKFNYYTVTIPKQLADMADISNTTRLKWSLNVRTLKLTAEVV